MNIKYKLNCRSINQYLPVFTKALFSIYIGLTILSAGLNAQENEWNRIANPGYKEYAPVTLANGIFGLTITEKAFSGNHLQLNGIFDRNPVSGVESAIRGIDFSNLDFIVMDPAVSKTGEADFIKGKVLSDTDVKELTNWRQEFNFREGWLKTQFNFQGIDVEHTVFVLKNMAQTGVIKLRFTAREHKVFSLKNFLVIGQPYQMGEVKYTNQLRDRKIPLFTASAKSPDGKYVLATTTSFVFADTTAPKLQFVNEGLGRPFLGFEKELKAGESLECYLIGSMATSYNYSDPVSESARLSIYTYLKGPEKVIAQHVQSWSAFWNKTDIKIAGAPELNKDIRQMMFFINSFVRPGTDFSSACMGLGSSDFWGHKTLWDADFWIYPALLLINPEAAKSMLEYRWKRLDMARQNAASHGYKGVMFPWESGSTGEEQTPLPYLTGPFQHHVTSTVGLAFWRYFCVTQDKQWLREKGFPVLKEVAEFWLSRVEKNEHGMYEIKNVVSSDEYAINVDNDAFTNGAAKSVLLAAVNAASVLGEKAPVEWSTVANGIVLRQFSTGITREHDTYNGEIIKQASVSLCSFPLDIITDKQTILKNLEYYEPLIDYHGPNMTWSLNAGAAARAGDKEKALYYFEKGLLPYKKGPFAILSLRSYGRTSFFGTSGGGLLQTFILGFGGIHFTGKGLIQKDPILPAGWKSIEMKGIGNSQNFKVE